LLVKPVFAVGSRKKFKCKCVVLCCRYTQLLSDAIAELIPDYKTKDAPCKDALDVYIEHRLSNARRHQDEQAGQNQPSVEAQFPSDLLRRFEIYWKPRTAVKSVSIRALRATQV